MSKMENRQPVAVLTGATSGIGAAVACNLGRQGYRLVVITRQRVVPSYLRHYTHDVLHADLSQPEEVDTLLPFLREMVPQVDVLVHAAGVFSGTSVSSTPVEELDVLYRVHLRSAFQLVQALLPALEAAAGQIVFINTTAVAAPRPNLSCYAATKNALRAFADALRLEVNSRHIRVLSVFPGRTHTAMQEQIFRQEKREYQPDRLIQPEDVAESVCHSLALPRTVELTDVWLRPMQAI